MFEAAMTKQEAGDRGPMLEFGLALHSHCFALGLQTDAQADMTCKGRQASTVAAAVAFRCEMLPSTSAEQHECLDGVKSC